jgi:hypothetical protein
MKKSYLLAGLAAFIFGGCADDIPKLSTVVSNSFDISKNMTKAQVKDIVKRKPTSMQRIDESEIWKFEGNEMDEDTEEVTYHNLTIKFNENNVSKIGTFSCKLPKRVED